MHPRLPSQIEHRCQTSRLQARPIRMEAPSRAPSRSPAIPPFREQAGLLQHTRKHRRQTLSITKHLLALSNETPIDTPKIDRLEPFPKLQISKIRAKPIRARGELQKPQSPKAELTQAPRRASMEHTAKRSRQRSEKLRPSRWPHSTGVRLVGGPGGDSC